MDSKHSVQSDTEGVVLDVEAGSGDKKPTSFFQSLHSVTFCTFMVVGISILWPWNCFLSATVYFQKYFFKETSGFAKVFASTTMVTSSVASVSFIVFLARRQRGYAKRVARGTLWQVFVFCALIVLMLVHNKFPIWLSFLLVMLVVFCSAMCTSTTQNGIYALANAFGSELSQALMIGQAIAGVMPSAFLFVVSVIGGESDEKQKWLALAYFVSSTLIPGLALLLYKSSGIASSFSTEQEAAQKIPYVPFKILFKNLKFLVLGIFTSFAASLVFPVFASNTHASVIPLSLNKYVPLVMTLWNAGDLAGRFLPSLSIFQSRHITPKRIFLAALVRILMVPVFFAFNINDARSPNAALDIFYMLWQFLFGLTNGAIVTLCFMKVGGCFSTDTERKAATGMVTIFLSTGLTTGSVISYLFGYFCTLVK